MFWFLWSQQGEWTGRGRGPGVHLCPLLIWRKGACLPHQHRMDHVWPRVSSHLEGFPDVTTIAKSPLAKLRLHVNEPVGPIWVNQVTGRNRRSAKFLQEGSVRVQCSLHHDVLVRNQIQNHLDRERMRHLPCGGGVLGGVIPVNGLLTEIRNDATRNKESAPVSITSHH